MDAASMVVLTTLRDRLKELTESASSLIVSLNNHDEADDLKKAEILSSKLHATLQRLTNSMNNYFQLVKRPEVAEISEITTVQLAAENVMCELDVEISTRKTQAAKTKEDRPTLSKLPKLELPQFDGDILRWYTFWDRYTCNIHNRNLPDVEKLLYLKSSLKGEALKLVEGLEITNSNYPIAIQSLQERYGKPSIVIDAHYAALYKIKKAEDNTADCRRVMDEIERNLRILHSLGENIDHNHLRFMILEKFPERIVYELQLRVKEETIKEMRDCLEVIISAHEKANRLTQGTKDQSYTTETLHTTASSSRGTLNSSRRNFNPRGNHFRGNNRLRGSNDFPRNSFTFKRGAIHFKPSRGNNYRGGTQRGFYARRGLGNSYNRPREMKSPERKKPRLYCEFCKGEHASEDCNTYKTIQERKARLGDRCFNCFEAGHISPKCPYRTTCTYCKIPRSYHHPALCYDRLQFQREAPGSSKSANTLHTYDRGVTVLQTAIATIQSGDSSKSLRCRLLLDSGSQRTYITRAIAKKLDLKTLENCKLSIYTFGSTTPQEIDSPLVKFRLQTKTGNSVDICANVVTFISQGVPYPEHIFSDWKDRSRLADDGSLNERVDILIGNDHYFSFISGPKHEVKRNLYLVESDLGWILSGELNLEPEEELTVVTYFQSHEGIGLSKPDLPLDNGHLKKLWDLETIGIVDSPKDSREDEAVRRFNETTEFLDNRYHVEWPWIEYPPALASNFGMAYGRLVNLIKRSDADTLVSYEETLRDQWNKGIIEAVPDAAQGKTGHPVHYLPHHGVKQPGKSMRIVYDASSKTKDSNSLNQCLYSGPLLLEDLTGLLIKFRCHAVGMCADVEKAFLQIALKEHERDVTRFLWLKDIKKPATDDNLLHLRFCRVPFGVISSPFLLNATIRLHLKNSADERIKSLADDIYVDNLVTGAETVQEALHIYEESKRTFREISMNLRDWSSNSKGVMKRIPDTCNDSEVKVLGLNWSLDSDTLQLRHRGGDMKANTKREVLKVVASIYDPCGYAAPLLLSAKLFVQDLWLQKVTWDTPFQDQHVTKWKSIQEDLIKTKNISVPRCYFKNVVGKDCQIHCFTDASVKAYAAVAYVVAGNEKSFVIGKTRVVPIKDQEDLKIPRLELLGVLIGSRLIKYVQRFLQLNVTRQILWTDSQIVIDWYNSNKLLPPFVARRIDEIKKNKDLTVRYVPSELNPADVATRPDRIDRDGASWLSGPQFLIQGEESWPISPRLVTSLLSREVPPEPLGGESGGKSHEEAQLDTTNRNEKNLDEESGSKTEVEELRNLQERYFQEELVGKETSLKRNLDLFIDVDGLLRCKGRFMNIDWSYEKRYPILIPRDCEFTNRVIMKAHTDNYHVGANHTLSIVRQKFWIPQGKSQVAKIIKKCPSCIKHGGGPFKLPETPSLPPERINYSAPFTFTGLDYLGPISVKTDTGTSKRWIALFTCLAVRAIHLELVRDLTAEEGLLALRRMVATRGMPTLITSDNATNFKLMSEVLTMPYCIENNIRWRFIPQLAPWFGGFYERLVGLVKNCLKRTLQKHLLNNNQLGTVIKEVEAVLNSRPLTCVDSELEHILRPSDFLAMGRCITMETAKNDHPVIGSTIKADLISSWKRGRIILDEFKDMFSNRYLMSLRERYNHNPKEPRITSKLEPRVGQVVQIKGDTKNREDWKVGTIVSLPKGSDGQTRIAKVNVNDKEFVRSLTHLYPLEMEESENPKDDTIQGGQTSSDNVMPSTEIEDMDVSPCLETFNLDNAVETNPHDATGEDPVEDDIMEDEQDPFYGNIVEVNGGEERDLEVRPKRAAAVHAAAKIKEWTRSLVSLF